MAKRAGGCGGGINWSSTVTNESGEVVDSPTETIAESERTETGIFSIPAGLMRYSITNIGVANITYRGNTIRSGLTENFEGYYDFSEGTMKRLSGGSGDATGSEVFITQTP